MPIHQTMQTVVCTALAIQMMLFKNKHELKSAFQANRVADTGMSCSEGSRDGTRMQNVQLSACEWFCNISSAEK
jgi:hypothetical protein